MARKQKDKRFRFNYAVLGEGITEQWYLHHLKRYRDYKFSIRPVLFADIGIEKAEWIIDELVSGGCNSIVFLTDYDTIVNQGKRDAFERLRNKYKGIDEVLICESMPSIEFWFLLHFKFTTKEFMLCEEVVAELKNHIEVYSKSAKNLQTKKWFNILMENNGLVAAKINAEKGLRLYNAGNVGEYFPFTKIHLAIKEFEKQKIGNSF
jgi:predicted ATP-dependent endonuclease of OLD family